MRQLLGEAIEGAVPTALMPVAFRVRLERCLVEGHQGLAALLGERHRHQGFEAALTLFLPGEGEDETRGGNDLAEHAAMPELLAGLRRPQAVAPGPTGPNVHRHLNRRVVAGT